MRTSARLTSVALATVALLVPLACGGDEDLQRFAGQATPTTAAGAIQRPSPTPTGPPAASGSIGRDTATSVPAANTPLPVSGDTGAISGALSYPSEGIPAQRVVAFEVGSDGWWSVDTATGDRGYLLADLPPGTYHVVAYVTEPGLPALSAGYSQYLPCGADVSCTDHSLVDVVVSAGETTTGVDTGDWYAPDGAFPPDPTQ